MTVPVSSVDHRGATKPRWVSIAVLIAALVIAGVVSYFASSSPDGLERVAEDHGFAASAGQHATEGGPLADYATAGVGNDWLSIAIAGVVGVAVVAGIAGVLFWVLRSRRTD